MTTKFTPGPWLVTDEPKDLDLYYNVESAPDEWTVAQVWADVAQLSSTGQAQANAHLIAAAPEMFAALHAAEWGGNRGEKVCPVCRRLDFEGHKADCLLATAIAKAGRA